LGTPFIELSSVDSTNNYALTQIHAGLAQHGTAFFAHEQLAGKGQRGKIWKSEKGSSLVLSVVINPHPLQVLQQFQLSACIALSVCEFFAGYAGDDTRVKWPNDLYWYDRKAGGILIENIVGNKAGGDAPGWQWAVVGIGINVNQVSFPADLNNPVSLKQVTGKNFDAVELAKELCGVLEKNFNHLIINGFEDIYTRYLSGLYKKNETVKLKKGSRVFKAIIKSVLPTGELVVQTAIEESFRFGEVEWVIMADKNEK
jgi:BirA family biotin operon repressor/biotin-[acetyl-CoA-carboxylase] ligase